MSAVPQRPSIESVAHKLAGEWAQRTTVTAAENGRGRIDGDASATELELVAAVLLNLQSEVAELRGRAADAERLANDLGFDMLYTLESAYVEGQDPAAALLYLARGWKRDMDRISAADCTEARALAAKLPDTSSVD